MGDPKKHRKKYSTPIHPWQRSRIEEEKVLSKEYGLRRKREIWKAESLIRKIRNQAKRLISATTDQAKKEEKQLLDKLYKLGLVQKDAKIDDILNLGVKDLLNRRLQTFIYKNGMTNTIKQARQFILHGHVFVDKYKVNTPSYIIKRDEEDKIYFSKNSTLSNAEHSEILKLNVKLEKEKKKKESEVKKYKEEKPVKFKETKKQKTERPKKPKGKGHKDALDEKKEKSTKVKKILKEVEK